MPHVKGDPRKKTETGRRLRALAARIPDREHLEQFVAGFPEEMRADVAAAVVPYVRFRFTDNTNA